MKKLINTIKIFLVMILMYIFFNIIHTITIGSRDRYCVLFPSNEVFNSFLDYSNFKNGICNYYSDSQVDYFFLRDIMIKYLRKCKDIEYNSTKEKIINNNFKRAVKELLDKYKDVNITE